MKGALAPSICGYLFHHCGGHSLWALSAQFACHPVKSILEQSTLTVWVPQLYPTTVPKIKSKPFMKVKHRCRSGYQTAMHSGVSLVQKVHKAILVDSMKLLRKFSAITQPLSDFSRIQINRAASDISTAADVLNTGFTAKSGHILKRIQIKCYPSHRFSG